MISLLKHLVCLAALLAALSSCATIGRKQYSDMSPQLRELLERHPAARKVLLDASMAALPNAGFRLRYTPAETMTASGPRSEFRMPFPVEAQVPVITIVEGQQPWDQFILLVFELHNTRGKADFDRLWRQARAGSITKEQFADAVMRTEFEAVRRMKPIVKALPLSDAEKASSHAYPRLASCPEDYQHFQDYVQRVSPGRRQAREYHAVYDGLRGRGPQRISFFETSSTTAKSQ